LSHENIKISFKNILINELFNQPVDLSKAIVQPLHHEMLTQNDVAIDVLRLDCIHPVISGNKWFKLKYHLQQAKQQNKKGIITFGGAWSNHLVATAFACRQAGLACIGIVRGEQPAHFSATLQDALEYDMLLQFVSRSWYSNEKEIVPSLQITYPDHYIVPQGGQSDYGVQGAAEILQLVQIKSYSHIACATGTGTMLAGLVLGSLPHQEVIGICSLKMGLPPAPDGKEGVNSLDSFVSSYAAGLKNYTIFYDYHFGGYARKTNELIQFMNTIYQQQNLPTDFVYTGKLLYGIADLLQKDYFKSGSRILIVHSGGLQGNRSLPAGTLTFL
jgi:1-aminocyclopropane-1-carboxylate deaminase